MAGGAAERAGLRKRRPGAGRSAPTPIVDGQQLREVIRASVDGDKPRTQTWQIERDGQTLDDRRHARSA